MFWTKIRHIYIVMENISGNQKQSYWETDLTLMHDLKEFRETSRCVSAHTNLITALSLCQELLVIQMFMFHYMGIC